MKILSEKEEKYVKMDVEFTKGERELLINYAMENMSNELIDNYFIEWAFIDLIKKTLDKEFEKKCKGNSKTKKIPKGILGT